MATFRLGSELAQPEVLDSRDGRLAVELTAAVGARLAGGEARALGYNGTSPGPTMRVRPGDELAVRLTNRLDQPTNLHTHGLCTPTGCGYPRKPTATTRSSESTPGRRSTICTGSQPITRPVRAGTTPTITAWWPISSSAGWQER